MTLVLSPHTDDAVFSLGAHLSVLKPERYSKDHITIATPFAAVPKDPEGRDKHVRLVAEHKEACDRLGASFRNGPFLDDVYPSPGRNAVRSWIVVQLQQHLDEALYVPVGIHHPDHLMLANLTIALLNEGKHDGPVFFYEELPYRVDYPTLAQFRLAHIENMLGKLVLRIDLVGDTLAKTALVDTYASQVDDTLRARVLPHNENIWELVR